MILIICGPPGVGKSTVAYLLQERLEERGRSFDVLDSDQFGRNTYEQMFERVRNSDEDWILSGTFYKREWQVRFERLERAVFVYLRADLETCLERNRNRETPIEERAVHVIWREFDDPRADITVDVADRTPDEVTDRIIADLDFPDDSAP